MENEKKPGDAYREFGKATENLGCAITILVFMGFFLWFVFKTLF